MKNCIFKHPAVKACLILVLAALLLFGGRLALKGLSETNTAKQQDALMHTLLPGSGDFTEEPYTGEDANVLAVYKADKGYVVKTSSRGYVDNIVVWVGVKSDGSVSGIKVTDTHETPGLGNRALTDWRFLKQFLKTKGDAEIGTNIDALSGATVTSKAIVRCVNSAAAVVTGADTASSATVWEG